MGTGLASLRFPAKQQTFRLYKNGVELGQQDFQYAEQSNGRNIKIISYNSPDVYTCSYSVDTSIVNPNMIDFAKYSNQKIFLRSFINNGVLGEKLSTIGFKNSAILSYTPYIDYSKFSGYSYTEGGGTVGQDNYSPVQVMLEDGSFAINLTNYLPNKYFRHNLSDSMNGIVYYIHSRKQFDFFESAI